jgi:co-chaperonin GroES (HSP10)
MSYLTTVGQVLQLGDLAYLDKDKFPGGAWCTVGDHVCYGKHAGIKLFYKGVRLILLFDDQIVMRVEDPKDLDPTFNLGKGSG